MGFLHPIRIRISFDRINPTSTEYESDPLANRSDQIRIDNIRFSLGFRSDETDYLLISDSNEATYTSISISVPNQLIVVKYCLPAPLPVPDQVDEAIIRLDKRLPCSKI